MNTNKYYLNKAIDICILYGFNITLSDVILKYSEPHRYWHTVDHLYNLLNDINGIYNDKKINKKEFDYLNIATIFHDIVYDTRKNDNEEKSVEYMLSKYDNNIDNDIKIIIDIILSTKTHESSNSLCKKFIKLDTKILDSQFIDMLDWENKIYKEYKYVGWKIYKKKRIEFLLSSIKDHSYNVVNIKNLIDYINRKTIKTGICYYEIDKLPHIDDFIDDIGNVNNLFDNVVVVIVYNSSNYNKEIIRRYAVCYDYNNEFMALNIDSFINYIKKLNNVTIVKEIDYIDLYNKKLSFILKTIKNIKEIYV